MSILHGSVQEMNLIFAVACSHFAENLIKQIGVGFV